MTSNNTNNENSANQVTCVADNMNQKELLLALGITRTEALKAYPDAGKAGNATLTSLLRDRYQLLVSSSQVADDNVVTNDHQEALEVSEEVPASAVETAEAKNSSKAVRLPVKQKKVRLLQFPAKPVKQAKTKLSIGVRLPVTKNTIPLVIVKGLDLDTLTEVITECALINNPVLSLTQQIANMTNAKLGNGLSLSPKSNLSKEVLQCANLSDPNFGKLLCYATGTIKHYSVQLDKTYCLNFDVTGLTVQRVNLKAVVVNPINNPRFSAEQILKRCLAACLVLQGFSYHLILWNCEHFSRLITQGNPSSLQVARSIAGIVYPDGHNTVSRKAMIQLNQALVLIDSQASQL